MQNIQKFKQQSNERAHNAEYRVIVQPTAPASLLGSNKKDATHVPAVEKAPSKFITIVPLSRMTVLKNCKTNDKPQPARVEGGIPSKYEKRIQMLSEYKELFRALMELPDKEIQKKILAVINSHTSGRRTIATQTDPVEIKSLATIKQTMEATSVKDNDVNYNSNGIEKNDAPTGRDSNACVGANVKKRKRKRKISSPKANKVSCAKQLAKVNKPKLSIAHDGDSNNTKIHRDHTEYNELFSPKRQRLDSFFSECSYDVVNICDDTEIDYKREIELFCTELDNGLLTIQDAVVKNQTNKLDLRIKIWQIKGFDLNEILTEEDEDLLQLAILNMCDPSIIILLLEKGLNPNSIDENFNTIIHLAILNNITVESFEHLMDRIELKLLLTLNDDGYTPLHLAVRHDRFLLAESLINVIDERLVHKVYYQRQLDAYQTDEIVLKKQFRDYYEKICLQMVHDIEEANEDAIYNHDLKQKLLQTRDSRSGNTALYFAIDNGFEHLIYFLLAHLTDPRTENLGGGDCRTYFSEFSKTLNLSLNIDNTMEKVIKLLS